MLSICIAPETDLNNKNPSTSIYNHARLQCHSTHTSEPERSAPSVKSNATSSPLKAQSFLGLTGALRKAVLKLTASHASRVCGRRFEVGEVGVGE